MQIKILIPFLFNCFYETLSIILDHGSDADGSVCPVWRGSATPRQWQAIGRPRRTHVVLHGVMDTPNPYFNRYRWGSACNDGTVASCINYFDKVFGALQNPAKGTYCNIFRLHLDPCWTNNGHASGEADISKFSADRLRKYLQTLYWPIAQKALNHGLYVVVRPPGVCPKDLKVGDAYQQYLNQLQKQFGNGVAGTGQRACACL